MTNTKVLNELIEKSGLKKSFIANYLNLSRQGFKNKCENKANFNSVEITKLCNLLHITDLEQKEHIF